MFHDNTRFLICEDCGEEFVFTAAAQEYFSQRGLNYDPTKCKHCYSQGKREKVAERPRRSRLAS